MKYYIIMNGRVINTAYSIADARDSAKTLSQVWRDWCNVCTKTTLKCAYDDGAMKEISGKLDAEKLAIIADYETPKFWYNTDGDPDVNFTGFSLLDLSLWYDSHERDDSDSATAPELPAGVLAIETRRAGDAYPAADTAQDEPAETVPETAQDADTAADAPADAAQPAQDTAADTAQDAPAAPQPLRAAQLHDIMHTFDTHVKYTGSITRNYDDDGYKIAYGARFIVGAMYRIPDTRKKSRAADIVFRVDRNTGKSVNITVWESYNGKITENTYKNKKLNPGSVGYWVCVDRSTGNAVRAYSVSDADRENYIDFTYWECIDLEKISRWTSGHLSVIRALPVSPDDFRRFMAADAPAAQAAPTPAAQATPAAHAVLDFSPKYYAVSEKLAEMHKNAMSYFDYKPGTVTNEYRQQVDAVYKLAEISADPEKSLYLADIYAKRLARWYDDYNRNGASCPSVLVAGFSNFPTRKKERQNARADVLMQQWERIQHMKEKIAHPERHEIRRETITDEFENVLYFRTEINTDANRLQLIFDGKPAENVRAILKNNGFRWSPRYMAWQRQLTENAVCAVWCVVDALDVLENADADAAAAQAAQIAAQTNTAA